MSATRRYVTIVVLAMTLAGMLGTGTASAVWGEGNPQWNAPESCDIGTFLYLSQRDNVVTGECLEKNPFLQPASLCMGSLGGVGIHFRTFGGADGEWHDQMDASWTVRTDRLMELQTRLRKYFDEDEGIEKLAITAIAFKYNGVDKFAYDGANGRMTLNGVLLDPPGAGTMALPRGGMLSVLDENAFTLRTTNGTRVFIGRDTANGGAAFHLGFSIFVLTEDLNKWLGLCNQDLIYFAYPNYLPSTAPPLPCAADCAYRVRLGSNAGAIVSSAWEDPDADGEGLLTMNNDGRWWFGLDPGVIVPQALPVFPEGMAFANVLPPGGAGSYRIAFSEGGQRVPIEFTPWTSLARRWNLIYLLLRAGGLEPGVVTDPAPLALAPTSLALGPAGTAPGCFDPLAGATRFTIYEQAADCVVTSLRSPGWDVASLAEQVAPALPGGLSAAQVEQALQLGIQRLDAKTVAKDLWNLGRQTVSDPYVEVTSERCNLGSGSRCGNDKGKDK